MVKGIGQIAITVKDLDAAVEFYRDGLGLEYLFSAPPKLAFFNVDGIRLMLTEPGDGDGGTGNSTIYFEVDDIDGSHRELERRKVTIVDRPHKIAELGGRGLWMFFVKDDSGNLLGLMQEK